MDDGDPEATVVVVAGWFLNEKRGADVVTVDVATAAAEIEEINKFDQIPRRNDFKF